MKHNNNNNNESSDTEISFECNQKVDDFLKALNDELMRGIEREELAKTKRIATQSAKHEASKINQNFLSTTQNIDNNNQYLEGWIKKYTDEVNEFTKNEIQSLEALIQNQQEIFQAQLAEKNDQWEKEVLQRREEAAQLRNMITNLQSLISISKNETKTDIEEAQKRASKAIQSNRKHIRKQIQQINDLTSEIEKENSNFELAVKQCNQTNSNATQQKKDQLARLQLVATQLRTKLKEKEKSNEIQFKEQVKIIREMRVQLQQSREAEKEKLEELQKLKRLQASISRKISAQKDESTSIQHQLAMCLEDNDEIQEDLIKLQNRMFPEIFNPRAV